MAPPQEYGKVIINNYSRSAGMAPVVFSHWLHRAMFTCRLCHVDIGFAMEGRATKINAATNMQGYYCGACHNGKTVFEGRAVFGACSERGADQDVNGCERCHSLGRNAKMEYDFDKFTENFPRENHGGHIDWEKAEAEGKIKLIDYIEGISMKRDSLKARADFSIESKATWMTDVIFSHKKHTAWNGCEVCHPDIFPSAKKGTVRYSMLEITIGNRYCGVCHDKVAFSLGYCEKCHTKPVR